MKRQPADPFGGAGHFMPKRPRKAPVNAPRSRMPKPFLARTEALAIITNIQETATAAIARLKTLDVRAACNDFEWIIQLADDARKVG